jgi:hypothetical protein
MRQHITARSGLVLVSIFVASLSAKGLPTRITIGGTSLATPIDIKDPAVLARFDIWAGPGTRSAGVEDSEGFIIDWRSGAVAAPPEALQRYRVSFFVKYRDGQEEQLAYGGCQKFRV